MKVGTILRCALVGARASYVVPALLACAGCASFSEPSLPRRELADLTRDGRLGVMTYQISDGTLPTSPGGWVAEGAPATLLASRLEPIFRLAFVETSRTSEPGEWHLDIYYREELRNPAVSYTLALFAICSLGLLPAYLQEDLYLEAKLQHAGATVRQVVLEESVSTWMHWLVLPWSFRDDPIERKAEIVDGMVLNLLFAIREQVPVEAAVPGERR